MIELRPFQNSTAASPARRVTLLGAVASLLLIGPAAAAEVTATPAQKIFGAAGATAVLSIAVSPGTVLGSVAVLTMGAPDLDFTAVATGTTCPALAAGACSVEVRFQPTAPGRRHGAVVLNAPDGRVLLSVSLVGAGSGALGAFGPGVLSTMAGRGAGGDGGLAVDARLAGPTGITADGFGNRYIADPADHRIRKVTPAGIISTFAGTGAAGYSGDGGPAATAQLSGPMAVQADGAGFIYIADTGNNVVRMVDGAGVISTYAGQHYAPGAAPPPVCAAATNAVGDGCPANQMILNMPVDLVFCIAQNLHVADKLNNRVRTVLRTTYQTITQVGNGAAGYDGEGGLSTSGALDGPTGMAMDASNHIYVAASGSHIVRKTLLTGTTPNPIVTVAGTPGSAGNSGDGALATAALLGSPRGVQVDPAGDVYVSDVDSQVIRKVNAATGFISTLAGTGTAGAGGDGGPASSGALQAPSGLLLDDAGNLYVADAGGGAIRKIDVADPPALDFADTAVGSISPPQQVTLMNLGDRPWTVGSFSAPADFSLGGAGATCSPAGDQALGPAMSCTLGVLFTPTTAGRLGGGIVLGAGSTPRTISLTGVAPGPARRSSGGCGSGPVGPWTLVLLGGWLLARGFGGAARHLRRRGAR